jgi:hypothetical protein
LLKIDCTNGMQPPQPVPALVHDLTSPMLVHVPYSHCGKSRSG